MNDAPDGSGGQVGNGGKSAILSFAGGGKFLVQTRNRVYFADYSLISGCYNRPDLF